MKTVALILFVYICFGITKVVRADPPNISVKAVAIRNLAELKIDIKEPFTKDVEPERIGIRFVLKNKSKQDLYFGYMGQATVSLYTIDDNGKRTRVWLPPGAFNDGSVRLDVIKAGESDSFVNSLKLDVLKEVVGKSVIASVRVSSPGDTEKSEVFSDIFKMPSLPVNINK